MNSNLTTLSEKVANRIAVLNTQRHKPQSSGFFMRNTSVSRYVRLGETVERLASSLGWYCNLIQLNTMIAVTELGFKTLPTEALMPKPYAQNSNPPRLNARLKSLFNLVKPTPQGNSILFKNLTFNQASGLVKQIPNTLVKFSKMEPMQ